jgi:hypothetical protein
MLRPWRGRKLDNAAIALARRYGMESQYREARMHGIEPLYALEDCEIGTLEERAEFEL